MSTSIERSVLGKFGFLALAGGLFFLARFLIVSLLFGVNLNLLYPALLLFMLALILLGVDPYVRSQRWALLRIVEHFYSRRRSKWGLGLAIAGLAGLTGVISASLEQGSPVDYWVRAFPQYWAGYLLILAPLLIGIFLIVTDQPKRSPTEQD